MSRRGADDIKVSQFLYEEQQVSVLFQKPLPATKIGDITLSGAAEGSESKLPLWAARALAAEGIVKINLDESQQLNPIELSKLSWKEERNDATLTPLPEDFYPKLRDLLTCLNDKIKQNPTHMTLSEHREAFMKAKDLINCRLQKILRLSFERNPSKSILDSMQPEEKALLRALRSEVDDWRDKILSEETE
jgi:hypothetical protein